MKNCIIYYQTFRLSNISKYERDFKKNLLVRSYSEQIINQKYFQEYFLKGGDHGFEEDVSICLIDQTDLSNPHNRENYLMRALRTIHPFGIKTKETY